MPTTYFWAKLQTYLILVCFLLNFTVCKMVCQTHVASSKNLIYSLLFG